MAKQKGLNWFDKHMAAVAFAEMGEHETALGFIAKKLMKRKQKRARAVKGQRTDQRPTLRM